MPQGGNREKSSGGSGTRTRTQKSRVFIPHHPRVGGVERFSPSSSSSYSRGRRGEGAISTRGFRARSFSLLLPLPSAMKPTILSVSLVPSLSLSLS